MKQNDVNDNKLSPQLVRTAIVMTIGMLCPMLGVNIVNVAVQTIGRELHAGVGMVQWLVTAYILCMGIAIPISGWFVDRFPAKPVYLIALGGILLRPQS
jgi:MFS family permease